MAARSKWILGIFSDLVLIVLASIFVVADANELDEYAILLRFVLLGGLLLFS